MSFRLARESLRGQSTNLLIRAKWKASKSEHLPDEVKEVLTLAVIVSFMLHFLECSIIIEEVSVSKILEIFEFLAKFVPLCL